MCLMHKIMKKKNKLTKLLFFKNLIKKKNEKVNKDKKSISLLLWKLSPKILGEVT